MRDIYDVLKNLVWITELGLSVAAPPVLCILAAVWLRDRFGLGGWVVVLGVLLGVGGAAASLVSCLRAMKAAVDGKKDDRGTSFNEHK